MRPCIDWTASGELSLRANRDKKPGPAMFELKGSEPGKAGISYGNAKPYTIPTGAYDDINSTPPCEIRLGSQGRGIWVKPQLPNEYVPRSGAVMIRPYPHVAALTTRYLGKRCSGCHEEPQKGKKLMRCQRCRTVCYCDAACQKFDWPIHKLECPALSAHAERLYADPEFEKVESENCVHGGIPVPDETIRTLARLLWLQSKQKPGSGKNKEFELMQSHSKDLTPSSPQGARYTKLGNTLKTYVSLGPPSSEKLDSLGIGSDNDVIDLISKFFTNAFVLTSPDLTPIGWTICPIIALINHSCAPNCAVVFPKARKLPLQIEVVALRNIKPGEELTISYVDQSLPRALRRSMMREQYMFTCECPMCHNPYVDLEASADPRRALRCTNRDCPGFLPMPNLDTPRPPKTKPKCVQCQVPCEVDTEEVARVVEVGEEGLLELQTHGFKDPDWALESTSKLLPTLGRWFHHGSHPLSYVAQIHLDLLIAKLEVDPSLQEEAIRAAARVMASVSATLPCGHPGRGVAGAKLGKLLAMEEYIPNGQEPAEPTPSQLDPRANLVWQAGDDDGVVGGFDRLRFAHHTLEQARKELRVGFGGVNDGGAVGKEIIELEKRIGPEVDAWRKAGGKRRPGRRIGS
ncbi:hypothetical protein BDV93DRAFT_524753 [Ceratobasidium sp. AG-I]|nr:hypothetical protein BDV93DRAFT_524753 [Ceratobasidium sp. AG-I]